MAPSRKSGTGRMVTMSVTPSKLRNILNAGAAGDEAQESASPAAEVMPNEEEKEPAVAPPANETDGSPTTSATLAATQANVETASDSNPGTPAANGTPAPGSAPADANGKRKGTKRSASTANLDAKPRGKPGPKKKPRLEDGTIDPTSTSRGVGAHKLGPKANQGAINAGLRALDRSGKPCRKWAKGSFKLKSFTGVVWEVHRWKAPTQMAPKEGTNGESAGASAWSSTNENKEDTQGKSDANSPNPAVNGTATNGHESNGQDANGQDTNGPQDIEMTSAAPSMPASPPALAPVAAAS